ncbi:MAG: hypothetical protein ABJH45_03000 [Paracoccaceae bacterium]
MEKVSNLTYNEVVQFYQLKLSRVEVTWFRIMYLHAALFAVLVFFYEAETFLTQQRILVLSIYTVNLLVFHVSLHDGYGALRSALADLKTFPETDGHIDQWFRKVNLSYKTSVRVCFMIISWLLVTFLLFGNLL